MWDRCLGSPALERDEGACRELDQWHGPFQEQRCPEIVLAVPLASLKVLERRGEESSQEAVVVGKEGGEKGAVGQAGASTHCPLEGPGITGCYWITDKSGVLVGAIKVTPHPPPATRSVHPRLYALSCDRSRGHGTALSAG